MQDLIPNYNNLLMKYFFTCNLLGCKAFLITTKYKAITIIVLQDPSRSNPNTSQPRSRLWQKPLRNLNLCPQAHQAISLFSKPQLLALLKLYSRSKCKLPHIWRSVYTLTSPSQSCCKLPHISPSRASPPRASPSTTSTS